MSGKELERINGFIWRGVVGYSMASRRSKNSWVIGFVYDTIAEEGPMCASEILDRMMSEKNRLHNRHTWLAAHTAVSLSMTLRTCGLFERIGQTRVATSQHGFRKQILWDVIPLEKACRKWMSKTHTTKRFDQLPQIMKKEIERIRSEEE
tara:strand:- start:23517 stop:23966 length:450 start_codon:yes stop_codon:yes gene_type:complete